MSMKDLACHPGVESDLRQTTSSFASSTIRVVLVPKEKPTVLISPKYSQMNQNAHQHLHKVVPSAGYHASTKRGCLTRCLAGLRRITVGKRCRYTDTALRLQPRWSWGSLLQWMPTPYDSGYHGIRPCVWASIVYFPQMFTKIDIYSRYFQTMADTAIVMKIFEQRSVITRLCVMVFLRKKRSGDGCQPADASLV